jgi:subtilase family serine protease
MHKRSITAAAIAATTVLASALAMTPASAAPTTKAVPNTKPAWVSHATHLGSAANSAATNARVYLAPRGGLAAVKQAALGMATPGSPSYHKFLTAAQYQARFGTTDATVRSVSAYLRSAGLTVRSVGTANRYVAVGGTVAAAEKAFATQLERYRHAGRSVQAPATSLHVPSSLAASVLTITGLDTSPKRVAPASTQAAPPPAGFP